MERKRCMKAETLEILLRIAVLAVTWVIVPAVKKWIEAKTDNEKLERIKQWARTAVAAAEQIYNHAKKSDPEGTLRRGYARKAIVYMAHKCGISLTEEEIEAMIEAAVNEINGSKLNVIECMEAEK